MMESLKILGISGSLRQASTNTALLEAAGRLLTRHQAGFSRASIRLPLYDADVADAGALAAIDEFKQAIGAADAVLIATPEYNFGPPGPLKNAIDWASRPAFRSVFRDKPVGVMGAAGGAVGTARAQGQLKQILLGMASQVFPYPELLVGNAPQRFDGEGNLIDADTQQRLDQFLRDFVVWVRRVRT
ncbi:MAG TPA: NADPH-dependent FMN reductase [Polyangiaceae bacterium]|nr:NADPH-dependent FMN reductase [Polyangiaceae bacterium]